MPKLELELSDEDLTRLVRQASVNGHKSVIEYVMNGVSLDEEIAAEQKAGDDDDDDDDDDEDYGSGEDIRDGVIREENEDGVPYYTSAKTGEPVDYEGDAYDAEDYFHEVMNRDD